MSMEPIPLWTVIDVNLDVSSGTLGIGGRLWDAGICLLRFFAAAPMETVSGKRVLELGAGTGVVGLGAAQLGASHVTITDLPSA